MATILAGIALGLWSVTGAVQSGNSGLITLGKRDALLGWEAVGRVDLGGRGYCTGVLIATDLVLTAAHCVYDRGTGRAVDAGDLTFRAGWHEGVAIAERDIAGFAAHPAYAPREGVSVNNLRHDVALLKLSRAIPAATAAPFALHSGARTGQKVSVVSYGRGRDSALSWQRECGLEGRQGGIMAFDCDVTFGSSGAPVFVREGSRARILTLVSSGGKRNGRTRAYGMELAETVATVKRALRAQGPLQRSSIAPRSGAFGQGARNLSGGGARFVKAKPRRP